MNKKLILSSLSILLSIASAIASNNSENNTCVSLGDNSGKIVENKKRIRIGFELGARGRVDCLKLSLKNDLAERFCKIAQSTNLVKMSQTDLSNAITAIGTEMPDFKDVVNALSKSDLVFMRQTYNSLLVSYFSNGGNLTAEDIKNPIDQICACVGVEQDTKPNTWNIAHDPKYILLLGGVLGNPSLMKNDLTVKELNDSIVDGDIKSVETIIDNASTKKSSKFDFVNFDLFANVFINYQLSDQFYLIGGVGGSFDLEGKGRPIEGRKSKKKKTDTSSSESGKDIYKESDYYHTKYAITPKIGFGIQCSKRFAIELTGYDSITKVEYDCSDAYKEDLLKSLASVYNGVTSIFPDKKQSSWVNRFGVELGFKFNITKNFFAKLGVFYTFPCNIFKKIQPVDLNVQSGGASLSLGCTF